MDTNPDVTPSPPASAPSRIQAAPVPPTAPPRALRDARPILATLLSVFFGLFLVDALVSLADDSSNVLFGLRLFSSIRWLACFLAGLVAVVVYLLMGLTPIIPKRWFLPLVLFGPVMMLLQMPLMIYHFGMIRQLSWLGSFCQVIVGFGILRCLRGGFKPAWPLVTEEMLGVRRFSWWNSLSFLAGNILVLPVVLLLYLGFCSSLALGHFTDGFMALRPGGITVQTRKYARADGKIIRLIPMAHIADAAFYQKVSQSFPSNSVILMEGVTDCKNLITNPVSYKRMAKAIGLGEQHEDFKPAQGEIVNADVDVETFSTNTIALLNLVMLVHANGVTPETALLLLQKSDSQPPQLLEQFFDDILTKRNEHLLGEIKSRLGQSDYIVVPWGAAHMAGISKEIQNSGFHLVETQDYPVIRFLRN